MCVKFCWFISKMGFQLARLIKIKNNLVSESESPTDRGVGRPKFNASSDGMNPRATNTDPKCTGQVHWLQCYHVVDSSR